MNIQLRLLFLLGLSALGEAIISVAFPWASALHGDITAFPFMSVASGGPCVQANNVPKDSIKSNCARIPS